MAKTIYTNKLNLFFNYTLIVIDQNDKKEWQQKEIKRKLQTIFEETMSYCAKSDFIWTAYYCGRIHGLIWEALNQDILENVICTAIISMTTGYVLGLNSSWHRFDKEIKRIKSYWNINIKD